MYNVELYLTRNTSSYVYTLYSSQNKTALLLPQSSSAPTQVIHTLKKVSLELFPHLMPHGLPEPTDLQVLLELRLATFLKAIRNVHRNTMQIRTMWSSILTRSPNV